MRAGTRTLSTRRRTALVALLALAALALGKGADEAGWGHHDTGRGTGNAHVVALPPPPPPALLALVGLGDRTAAAALAGLWLRSFDFRAGVDVPLAALDYARLTGWLERLLALDPRAEFPLRAAAQYYALVPDPRRRARMLDFIHRSFRDDPHRRWPWLVRAALVARFALGDEARAARYARTLAEHSAALPGELRRLPLVLAAGAPSPPPT